MKYLAHKFHVSFYVILISLFICCGCQSNQSKTKDKEIGSAQNINSDSGIRKISTQIKEDSTSIFLRGCCDTLAQISWKNKKLDGYSYAWSDVIKNPLEGENIEINALKGSDAYPRRKYIWWFETRVIKKRVLLFYLNENFICEFDTTIYAKDTINVHYNWHSKNTLSGYSKSVNGNRIDTAKYWHQNGNLSSMEIYNNKTHKAISITYFKEDGKTIIDEFYEGEDGNPIYRIKDGKKVK